MSDKQKFTELFLCGHCGNKAPMEVVGTFSTVTTCSDDVDENHQIRWEEGHLYELVRCPACSDILLRRAYWHDGMMDPSDISFDILYPAKRDTPRGMADRVRKAYEAATKVRSIDPNAYGVLLGRVLELLCEDRGAKGDHLAAKLHDLSSKGEIPKKLTDVADGLRHLRNVGAHASLGELTGAEVPVLDALTRAILEYVYTVPLLVKEASDRLDSLKTSNRKKKQ